MNTDFKQDVLELRVKNLLKTEVMLHLQQGVHDDQGWGVLLSPSTLGSISDTVSKILKDTAIFSICTVSKIHII